MDSRAHGSVGSTCAFPTWRKTRVATELRTGAQFLRELRSAEVPMDELAISMLLDSVSTFAVDGQEREIEIALVSGNQLGFSRFATRAEVFDAATQQSLLVCPPDTGPLLRLCDKEWTAKRSFTIAMRPIVLRGGRSCLFAIECDRYAGKECWRLIGEEGTLHNTSWSPETLWAFAKG